MSSFSNLSLAQARDRVEKVKNELAFQTNQSAQKHTKYILDQLANYPPPRPGQKYVRTLTLKRGWEGMKPVVTGGNNYYSITVRFANPAAPYWIYVQDEKRQRPAFRGRWKTLQQIIKDYMPTMVKLVDKDIQDYIDITMDR